MVETGLEGMQMSPEEWAEFQAFKAAKASGAPVRVGPDKLVGKWTDMKKEFDRLNGRIGVLVAEADEVRTELYNEFGITVPPLRPVLAARESVPGQAEQQPIARVANATAPITSERDVPDAHAIAAEAVAEGAAGPGSTYVPPAQKSVEVEPIQTTTVEQIRKGAAVSGGGGGEDAFAAGIANVLGTLRGAFPN